MKGILVALVTLVSSILVSAASASIMVLQEPMPTVGVPGGTTWKVTLVSDNPNEIIYGVDARFSGTLGQVRGGPITSTPFQDSNAFFDFIGADVSQDSQFLFQTNQLNPPPLAVVDTEAELGAAITNLPGATGGDGLSIPLAQLAIGPGGTRVYYRLEIDVRDPSGRSLRLDILESTPEPSSLCLTVLAGSGLCFRRRRS
ncbi:MAG: PEP-CTERM sorting domain-containing protein [Planctomycetales bacterium]|nr:PEP-CTERM sorting domain-containing protein [Planctomycetales bacterium]